MGVCSHECSILTTLLVWLEPVPLRSLELGESAYGVGWYNFLHRTHATFSFGYVSKRMSLTHLFWLLVGSTYTDLRTSFFTTLLSQGVPGQGITCTYLLLGSNPPIVQSLKGELNSSSWYRIGEKDSGFGASESSHWCKHNDVYFMKRINTSLI